MAQSAIRCPFAEVHLGDEFRLYEVRAAPRGCIERQERRRRRGARLELFHQVAPLGVRKAGPDFAGEAQAFALESADQQRTQRARMLRLLGIAADDQFLLLDAFRLEPGIVSARLVRRLGPLRDNAFQSKIAGPLKYRITGLNEMLAVSQQRRRIRE